MKPTCTEILRVLPCDPVGPYRESLASWLIRTAEVNDTSPALLLERKFAQVTPDRRLSLTSRALGASIGQTINGCGEITRLIVQRAEALTQVRNLRASTVLNFAPFASTNGLLRGRLAWSAAYLKKLSEPYYPLIWNLDAVRVCPDTKKPLESLCPSCRQPLAVLSGRSRAGHCSRCGTSLVTEKTGSCSADPVKSAIRSIDYEVWIANQLGEFVKRQAAEALPASFDYALNLRFWLDKFELSTDAGTAKLLSTTQPAISSWLIRGAIPKLRTTLSLCWIFGVSLRDFLDRQVPDGHDGKLREPIDRGIRHISASRRRPVDKCALESQLLTIIRENKFALMPFRQICAKKIKRRDIVVRQYFPEHSRAISRRYLDNRRLLAESRQAQFCTAIQTTARFLHQKGMVPNHKTLKPYLDRGGKLMCDWAIRALREVRIELGYEDRSEQLFLPI